jgi:hypothetical protein
MSKTGLSLRERVIDEIIQTEKDYVWDLNILINVYMNPLLSRGILSANEVQRLFSNITTLVKINEGMNFFSFLSLFNSLELLKAFNKAKNDTLSQNKPLYSIFLGDIFLDAV